MLRNHFISACRNLWSHKGFTFIHIGGLALGLTAGILVLHYARLEYGFDQFHLHSERTYRVSTERLHDGIPVTHFASTFSGVGPALKNEYSEVEACTRIFKRHRGGIISHGTTHIREDKIVHVDSGFFDVFSFPIIKGDERELLKPGSAFIEERMGRKYFGNENPIGKQIKFGSFSGVEEYEIKGVFQCPENSSLKFNFLFNYHDLERIFEREHESNWVWLDFHTFITLREGSSPELLESKLEKLLLTNMGDRAKNAHLKLQALHSIYLNSTTKFETGISGDENTVRILLLLGIIILVIVALNFINLSTSRSLTRAKEVGIRKIMGSSQWNLISQFFIETAVVNMVAISISVCLIVLLLPTFNQLTSHHIGLAKFLLNDLWKYLLIIFLVGTLVIGLYPSLMLSSFKSVEALKGFFSPQGKGSVLREVFVGFQAIVSFSLVTSILIVIEQVRFVSQKDIGIDISNTLAIRTPDVVTGNEYLSSLSTFKNELLQNPGIISVSTTVDSPGTQVDWIGGSRRINADRNDVYSLYRAVVDEDFFNLFGPKIISGKMFYQTQSDHDILINRKAMEVLKFPEPDESIGQPLLIGSDTFTIIGVIENFHQVSPREDIVPTVYHYNLESPRLFMVKYNTRSENEIIKIAGNLFQKLYPNVPFDYYFLDTFYDNQYAQERNLTSIISSFCVLAISISALGLLGLTWFRLSRQKKNLAIRKVVGSSHWQLFVNASGRLLYTTLAGCIIGIPITWVIMNNWLETFSYHTHPKIWQFCVALFSSALIALVSISGHTLKVIWASPVKHLRQE